MRREVVFFLNGARVTVAGRDAWRMTADWLRRDRHLTGTKIVCAEGDCGACTVLRAKPTSAELPVFEPVNACILPLFALDGCALLTVEALGDAQRPGPVQAAMRDHHGAQCGYCTPGIVVALAGALETKQRLDPRAAANALTGNLCRCTGYAHILKAATAVVAPEAQSLAKRWLSPAVLSELRAVGAETLRIEAPEALLLAPTTLAEAVRFLAAEPEARIVAAATDLGVAANRDRPLPSRCLTLQHIPELARIEADPARLTVGARATLTALRRAVRASVPELARLLDVFASPQIKNAATLVGNLANASPIGDTLPFLLVADAEVELARWQGGVRLRRVAVTELFAGYRQLALLPGELIARVSFALPPSGQVLKLYKVAQRKDLDIATVAAAFACTFDGGGVVTAARIAFGGVAATPLRLPTVEQALIGRHLDAATLAAAERAITGALTPLSDARGSAAYRLRVAAGLLRRYAAAVTAPSVVPRSPLHLSLSRHGAPPHDSAAGHVTGQSQYVDDRAAQPGELHVGVVWSPHPRARLLAVDAARARALPGVACVLTAADVAHNRWGSIFPDQPILADDEVHFVGEAVALVAAEDPAQLRAAVAAVAVAYEPAPAILSLDAAIAAQSFIGPARQIARGGADAAIAAAPHRLAGTLRIGGQDHFYLENQAAIAYPRDGGRLELHASTQHPTETQHVAAEACGLQFADVTCIAQRLGGAFGGKESQAAPIAAWAALVAQHTGRPARLVLSKDDDMVTTGKRNPFRIDWRVGFDEAGQILGLDAELWGDGGAFADLSTAIMERAMLHVDNASYLPHVRIRGQVCRTNVHPHTAFRGFGGPKGVALIEMLHEQIAQVLGRDALDVRLQNVYAPGRDTTPYGQTVANNQLPALLAALATSSDYRQRREAVRTWNRAREETVRGLSLTAVKFGIAFTTRFLNQANALVILHRDASIQFSTGAVEMGQGVQTRLAQLIAEQFGVALAQVRVVPTATDRNANTSPTAASSGTDLNGAAALDACLRLRQRLATLLLRLETLPRAVWGSQVAGLGTRAEIDVGAGDPAALAQVRFAGGRAIVQASGFSLALAELLREAWLQRISLTEYGFFRTPELAFDKVAGQGPAFLYFAQGAAASEVEINRTTGETKVRRVDILMDVGEPINADLDVGQIAGGFVQGMGWVTTEKLVYAANGKLMTHAPSTYKIPNIQDIPRDFRIALWPNPDNTANLRGTKAVGEPPLLLGLSVWTALQDALAAATGGPVDLAIPAGAEVLLGVLAAGRSDQKSEP